MRFPGCGHYLSFSLASWCQPCLQTLPVRLTLGDGRGWWGGVQGFPTNAVVGYVPDAATVRSNWGGPIPERDQQGSEALEDGLGILTMEGRCPVGAGE